MNKDECRNSAWRAANKDNGLRQLHAYTDIDSVASIVVESGLYAGCATFANFRPVKVLRI